jgi:hypothetical protein
LRTNLPSRAGKAGVVLLNRLGEHHAFGFCHDRTRRRHLLCRRFWRSRDIEPADRLSRARVTGKIDRCPAMPVCRAALEWLVQAKAVQGSVVSQQTIARGRLSWRPVMFERARRGYPKPLSFFKFWMSSVHIEQCVGRKEVSYDQTFACAGKTSTPLAVKTQARDNHAPGSGRAWPPARASRKGGGQAGRHSRCDCDLSIPHRGLVACPSIPPVSDDPVIDFDFVL